MKCEIKIGSRRTEEWALTSYYCPHCSAKTVWEADDGVYPEGPELFCPTCGGVFYGPEPSGLGEDLRLEVSDCTQIPEFRISVSFSALKSRNSRHFMYSNPGRKNLPRNGEDRERLRSC
jgi:hypothetical protein